MSKQGQRNAVILAQAAITKAEHQRDILRLTREGFPLVEIAEKLDITIEQASRYRQEALAWIVAPEANLHRGMLLEQLQSLQSRLGTLINTGNTPPSVKAVTEARNLISEIAKLCGLYPKEEVQQVQVGIKIVSLDRERFFGQHTDAAGQGGSPDTPLIARDPLTVEVGSNSRVGGAGIPQIGSDTDAGAVAGQGNLADAEPTIDTPAKP